MWTTYSIAAVILVIIAILMIIIGIVWLESVGTGTSLQPVVANPNWWPYFFIIGGVILLVIGIILAFLGRRPSAAPTTVTTVQHHHRMGQPGYSHTDYSEMSYGYAPNYGYPPPMNWNAAPSLPATYSMAPYPTSV